MKFSLVAVAAAMVAGASASQHHQHESFHKRGAFARAAHNVTDLYPTLPSNGTEECGCYTTWVTTYGEPTREWSRNATRKGAQTNRTVQSSQQLQSQSQPRLQLHQLQSSRPQSHLLRLQLQLRLSSSQSSHNPPLRFPSSQLQEPTPFQRPPSP